MNMKTNLVLLGMICLTLLTAGCDKDTQPTVAYANSATAAETNHKSDQQQESPKDDAILLKLTSEEMRASGVQVEQILEQTMPSTLSVTATIQPNLDKLAHVAPRVSGRIVKVSANLGQVVKQGQMLAQLDSIDLGEAHSVWLQAASNARLAEANFSRIDGLYADQIVTQKDFLNARAENEKAQTTLRAARDRLRMLGITPTESNSAVSVFPLVAPFSGTVIQKDAVLGELAQPDKSLFTVADLSTVWIEADLYEKDLSQIHVGAEADITVTAYPNEIFKGHLTYVSNTLDKESRTLKGRIEVRNLDGRLKPEMFASAALHTPSSYKALRLPEDAVLLVQGQPTIFVAKDDGFEPRAIEVGDRAQGQVAVNSGLVSGESVAVQGAYALKARMLKSQIGEAE